MNIEFHTMYTQVSEKLVAEIRNEIRSLSKLSKRVSGADVYLREDTSIISSENKICEIRLIIYGSNLVVYSRTENFKDSIKEALKELKKLVKQQIKKQKEPAVEIFSIVSV